jgi:hypothetical protein
VRSKADAGQHPSELETEDVEKEVDVARKVLVPVHAALAESVVGGEVCFLPDAAAFFRVAAASGASTSSGRRAGGAMASAAAESEPTTCIATRSLKRGLGSRSCLRLSHEGGPRLSQGVSRGTGPFHASCGRACCSEQAKSKCSPGVSDTQDTQLRFLESGWMCGAAVRNVKECPVVWYEERSVLQFF